MKIVRNLYLYAFLICLFFSCKNKETTASLDKKIIENRIIDNAGLLTTSEEQQLFALIQKLEKEIGPEIAIVIIETLDSLSIEQYSLRVFEELRLGRPTQKDGLLIVLAHEDRKARIEVGYGLERIIKDEIASRILTDRMFTKFKENRFFDGFYSGVDTITTLIKANRSLVGKGLRASARQGARREPNPGIS